MPKWDLEIDPLEIDLSIQQSIGYFDFCKMNARNVNVRNRRHAGDFHTERYFLRVGKANSIRNQRKRGRTAYCGLALVLVAALNSLLTLKCVEGFQIPFNNGESSKPKYDQQIISRITSLSTSANPLKLAGDETASAESVSTSGIDTVDTDLVQEEVTNSANVTANQLLLNFNASGSIGSLLLQMQKKEAELKLLNKSASLLFSEDQALKLDPTNAKTTASKTVEEAEANSQKSDLFSWIRKQEVDSSIEGGATTIETSNIDDDIAMELDSSVSIRITNSVKDITILEPPELDRIKSRTGAAEKKDVDANKNDAGTEETPSPQSAIRSESQLNLMEDNLPTLSKSEHYDGRIGRDIRHLAVSTASCIDSVEEWQLFCQQSTGGLEPLIECIRDGAKSIRKGSSSPTDIKSKGISARNEENFRVASSACKVLRDLCALSQDLAAVITDGILRANAAYNITEEYSLMDDMCTILRQADDLLDISNPSSEKSSRRKKQRPFRRRQNPENEQEVSQSDKSKSSKWTMGFFRGQREARLRCKLHVTQLLLAMTIASDSAVDTIRSTEGLKEALIAHSSYARKELRRRWMRYPGEKLKSMWLAKRQNEREVSSKSTESKEPKKKRRQPFLEAASLQNNLNGRIKGTANQVLAAIGHNEWVPKIPGQKGLRILCLDGGGSRGMTSVIAMNSMVEALGGMEVADCFDMVVGTSTGAIIAFLVGLNLETSEKAVERYDVLIEKIFTKSAFSTPLLLFTTASYDESTFMDVLTDTLGDYTMLDSRANAAVPLVFAVTSKMSSNPTHVALFRNYNYNGGELPDPFLIRPDDARENLDLPLNDEGKNIRKKSYPKKKGITAAPGTVTPENGSRHPGSFRVLKKYALRASTAAPTVFKPVLMGGEMYCDGGIVASNPSAIAIHEARTIFPDVPIELVVSIGTGGFTELKSEPRIGWDGIIGQIVNSACDAEQVHHILEDVLGDGNTAQGKPSLSNTSYMRFNPILGMPDEFPIDVTEPEKLQQIKTITREYMKEPEQLTKLKILSDILKGRTSSRFKWLRG